MWETICDAWACWSGWKFGPKFYSLPLFCNTEYPPPPPENENCQKSWHFDFSVAEYPPPENWNLGRSWHFVIFQLQNTPPPRKLKFRLILAFCDFSPPKMKIVRNLGTLTFQLQNTPPPKKLKFRQILALCDFSVAEYPPPPKIENWNLGRSNLGTL